jgi:type IV secretory pathway VirB4 component
MKEKVKIPSNRRTNMFNYEDILAQMNNGATAEDIAKAFTEQLNKAIHAQEEEAKVQAEHKELLADAAVVAQTFNDFTDKWYGNIAQHKITAEEILDVYELIAGLNIKVDKLKNGVKTTMNLDANVDKVIDSFLTSLGL